MKKRQGGETQWKLGATLLMTAPDFHSEVIGGRGKGSGVPVELRWWGVYWVAEGKIARRQVFWNRDSALEAAGLEE